MFVPRAPRFGHVIFEVHALRTFALMLSGFCWILRGLQPEVLYISFGNGNMTKITLLQKQKSVNNVTDCM